MAYQARRRFANLDGLRFICIAMVLWHHAIPASAQSLQIAARGFLGVDFFFVLSGFLITTLLLRERAERGRFSLYNFYIRRILRILPVYFFVVSLVGAYYIILDGQTEFLDLLPYYYLFLSNFLTEHIPLLGITWSLSVEEQYYMLWPLLLSILPVRLVLPVLIGLVAVNVLISAGLWPGTAPVWGPLVFKLPTATYAPILLGSLAAWVLHSRQGFTAGFSVLSSYWAVLIGFAILGLFLHFGPQQISGFPNLVIHCLMTLILMSLVVREDGALSGLLQTRWIMRFGAVSYGIYLYHLIALDIVKRGSGLVLGDALGNTWALFLIYSILSYVIAEISFRTLETWFQSFRPKLQRSMS